MPALLADNAIDPSLMVDAAGGEWLTLGSFWQGIQIIAIDKATGLPAAGARMADIARRTTDGNAIEASFAVYQPASAAYFLFVSFDKCVGIAGGIREGMGWRRQRRSPTCPCMRPAHRRSVCAPVPLSSPLVCTQSTRARPTNRV